MLDGDLALADLVVNGGTVLGTGSANGMTFNGGTLSPGASPGIITSEGDFTLAVAATYFVELNNTTPGTGHDQLVVNGTVSFAGALSGTTGSPAIGSQFVIILNDGVDPVVGTFAGLAEGAALSISGMPFAITYQGGSGNDVVLIAGPVPTTTTTTTVTTTTVTTTTPTTIPTTTTATTTNPLSTVAPTTTLIPGGVLPPTGNDPWSGLTLAVVVLMFGLGLLGAARRRWGTVDD